MNKLSHREHARLAEDLIDECGGQAEAAKVCRVGKSTLSTYANPHEAATMPADVIADLEWHCRKAIYSSALADLFAMAPAVGDLAAAACDLTEQTTAVQGVVRRSLADGDLTPREIDAIADAEREAEQALDRLKSTRRAIEAGTDRKLRAVS